MVRYQRYAICGEILGSNKFCIETWNAPPWQVEHFPVPEPFDLETYGEMLTLATERFAGVGMF